MATKLIANDMNYQ